MRTLNIALIAHDSRKEELVEWFDHNLQWLSQHKLYATGTTAKLLRHEKFPEKYWEILTDSKKVEITALLSGPLGGDQQIGAMIAEGKIDMLIFFCDNLITQGHQQDVGALTRLASLYNIAFATNRTTADMLITSTLLDDESYNPITPEAISNYKNRQI